MLIYYSYSASNASNDRIFISHKSMKSHHVLVDCACVCLQILSQEIPKAI